MRWSTQILVLVLSSCSVLAAPMMSSSSTPDSDSQIEYYRQNYHSQLGYLGLEPNPGDSRLILFGTPLEVTGLHKYFGSAREDASQEAIARAAEKAVRYANALGTKIKSQMQGPLHPDNIERQTQSNLQHLHDKYQDLLQRFNHPNTEFAYGQIYNHPNYNGMWAEYAASFIDLVEEAIPLVPHRG